MARWENTVINLSPEYEDCKRLALKKRVPLKDLFEEAKKVAPPPPVKVSSTTINKLEKSTGKQHQEELNKIGTAPIAVP